MGLKSLLMFLLLSGWGPFYSSQGVTYHFVDQPMSWTAAQTLCRTNYTDLLTIDSAALSLVFTDYYPGISYWIGLYDNNVSWTWLEGSTLLNSVSTNLLSWSSSPPDWSDPREYCVAMLAGKAFVQDCSLLSLALCSKQAFAVRLFLLDLRLSTWEEGQANCASVLNDLASVWTTSDKNTIQIFFTNNILLSTTVAWIGLYRKPWMWSDQSTFSFRNWGLEKNYALTASRHCVSVTGTGVWRVTDCATQLPFVCYEGSLASSDGGDGGDGDGVRKEQVVRMTITSLANMNNPAVQNQILQQLNDEMTDQGVSDFNLRWIQNNGVIFTEIEEEDAWGV